MLYFTLSNLGMLSQAYFTLAISTILFIWELMQFFTLPAPECILTYEETMTNGEKFLV